MLGGASAINMHYISDHVPMKQFTSASQWLNAAVITISSSRRPSYSVVHNRFLEARVREKRSDPHGRRKRGMGRGAHPSFRHSQRPAHCLDESFGSVCNAGKKRISYEFCSILASSFRPSPRPWICVSTLSSSLTFPRMLTLFHHTSRCKGSNTQQQETNNNNQNGGHKMSKKENIHSTNHLSKSVAKGLGLTLILFQFRTPHKHCCVHY